VVVSAKVSKRAVRRNQLRRWIQEQLLRDPPRPSAPSWLVFSLKPGSRDIEKALLLGECLQLLRKADLQG
jgi:ribonuclease P protein component